MGGGGEGEGLKSGRGGGNSLYLEWQCTAFCTPPAARTKVLLQVDNMLQEIAVLL